MKLLDWHKAVIEHGELYRVGGSVRDELMGLSHGEEDVDYLVRGITPERLEEVLSLYGRVVLVGKSFGVYKFKLRGDVFEHDIAFPRREVSTGPGHREFDIEWKETLPIEDDLGRRDFTINAIAKNVVDDTIVDPFNGRHDIDRRVLRMIFPEAFREDPLRVLRGIRFAARFKLDIDGATEAAMKSAALLLESLSLERVQEEFNKIFAQCDKPSKALWIMHRLGALAVVLPELDRTVDVEQNEYHSDDVFWHSVKSCDCAPKGDALLRWAALLHDIGKVDAKQTLAEDEKEPRVVFYGHEKLSASVADEVLGRLRYGNEFVKRCVHLIRQHMYYYQPEWNRGTVRKFIRKIGVENLEDLFALRTADLMSRGLEDRAREVETLRRRARDEIEAQLALQIEDMTIDGNDVMKVVGVDAGERVGEILQDLFEQVLERPSINERTTLLKMLEDYKGEKDSV